MFEECQRQAFHGALFRHNPVARAWLLKCKYFFRSFNMNASKVVSQEYTTETLRLRSAAATGLKCIRSRGSVTLFSQARWSFQRFIVLNVAGCCIP